MIETLYGKIIETDPLSYSVIIECAGVGYKTTVSANTFSKLPQSSLLADGTASGSPIRIYTHMAVKEDAVELYGFYSRQELEAFKLLISVSGVGPKAGMSILSLFTPSGLSAAIASGDSKSISRAPGVGPKTAARVVLELKDKFAKLFPTLSDGGDGALSEAASSVFNATGKLADAQTALQALGYSRSETAAAMRNVDVNADVETIIKQALNALLKS